MQNVKIKLITNKEGQQIVDELGAKVHFVELKTPLGALKGVQIGYGPFTNPEYLVSIESVEQLLNSYSKE